MTSKITFGQDGLVPGIVQDATTGRVLMLGYLNKESLKLTRETGNVHFWSRSRSEMWEKGATSGNYLTVVSITCLLYTSDAADDRYNVVIAGGGV